MDVTIKNCRCIDQASIVIDSGKLNLKFAPNGTGKSSIAQALSFAVENASASTELVPFKWRQSNSVEDHPFQVSGLDGIDSVEVFDEKYVQTVVFQPDSLFPGSFDVFVRTSELDETERNLKSQLHALVKLVEREDVRSLCSDLDYFLANLVGKSGLNGERMPKLSTPIVKALEVGNTWSHEDPLLTAYKPILASGPFKKWASWHSRGKDFILPMKGACPYCGQSISDVMGRIEAVGSNFASAKVGNIDKVIDALSVGSAYMNESAFEKLNSIVDSALPITDSAKGFVGKVVLDAQIIIEAIERARSVSSYFDLSGADDLDAVLDNCKIDVGFVDSFESTKCCELIGELNDAIEAAKSNSGKLKGLVNRQKAKLAKSLNERCREINSFLMTAGYPYRVEITSVDRGACSVKLVHQSSWEVEDSREALSYGERNAFALVFFAYECMRKRPDLIILDDPISSFDGAKRFALLNMLFLGGAGEASLKCKTVLLLTHDYGTLYDVARTHRHRFQPLANSSVLSCVDGRVFETFVDAGDMVRADILYNELARTSECLLTRLVYARKVLEFENDKGSNAYDVVSSLFHHRPEPLRRDGTPMDEFDISNGIDRLVFIVDKTVNYDKLLSLLECPSKMLNAFDSASSNYEKIQLARIATQAKVGDTVIKDRMDDSVHIGNGYLYQLNPLKFELVPHHLVVRCREELQAIASVC